MSINVDEALNIQALFLSLRNDPCETVWNCFEKILVLYNILEQND